MPPMWDFPAKVIVPSGQQLTIESNKNLRAAWDIRFSKGIKR
jgi:hypothetical protein